MQNNITSMPSDLTKTRFNYSAIFLAAPTILPFLILGIMFFFINYKKLFLLFSYPNDQVEYITIARYILDNHSLASQSPFLFNATLNTTATHLYMPGYFATLTLFYRLFHFSAFVSILPSMLAYIFSSILIYLIGWKLYGHKVGLLSSLLFSLYPANILMSYQVMTEMTLTFVCLITFLIFLNTPLKYKYFIFPLVLPFVFLFRQTTILIALPMLAVLFNERNKKDFNISKLILSLSASAIIIELLNFWQINHGLYPINMRLLLNGGFNYGSAFQAMPESNLIHLLINHALYNLHLIASYIPLNHEIYNFTYTSSILIYLPVLAVTFLYCVFCYKEDMYPFSSFLLVTIMAGLCILLYSTYQEIFYRMLMFTYPFLLISFSKAIYYFSSLSNYAKKNSKIFFISSLMGLFILLTILSCINIVNSTKRIEKIEANNLTFMETLPINKNKLLASPIWVSMAYVYKNYPSKWAFPPDDKKTLNLLIKKYDLGTLILTTNDAKKINLHNAVKKHELILKKKESYNGENYLIYTVRKR
jgi:4-amino-4-deoxy-L-arabinose transferase-like glycosyltransferase